MWCRVGVAVYPEEEDQCGCGHGGGLGTTAHTTLHTETPGSLQCEPLVRGDQSVPVQRSSLSLRKGLNQLPGAEALIVNDLSLATHGLLATQPERCDSHHARLVIIIKLLIILKKKSFYKKKK